MAGYTSLHFVGGHLALDFVNTETAASGAGGDELGSYGAAIDWLGRAGALSGAERDAMGAFDGSGAAREALAELCGLRGVLRGLLDALRTGGAIPREYVDRINERLGACRSARTLVLENGRYRLRERYRFERPRDLLAPIVNAAAELVATVDLTRVKRCGSACCDMYFLDTSRNRSRTWCDMAGCGNRAKAAAYYRRSRAGKRAPAAKPAGRP